MSQIPNPIETTFESNEGFRLSRSDADLVTELVNKFNELVVYLGSISERL